MECQLTKERVEGALVYFTATSHPRAIEFLRSPLGKPSDWNVLLSAPHTVAHRRDGVLKFAEPDTGVLARLLRDELGCPAVYSVPSPEGFDCRTYQNAVAGYVDKYGFRFVIDLHQMRPDRKELIELGTGGDNANLVDYPEFSQMARESFAKRFVDGVSTDSLFPAKAPYTVAAHVSHRCAVACLQIEINSALLVDHGENFVKVFDSLVELIRSAQDRFPRYRFGEVKPQLIEKIRGGKVVVAAVDSFGAEVKSTGGAYDWQIVNAFTGENVRVGGMQLEVDSSQAPGTIRLDLRRRTFLGVDLPSVLPEAQYAALVAKGDAEAVKAVECVYSGRERVRRIDGSQEEQNAAMSALRRFASPCLQIVPIRHQDHTRGLLELLLGWCVGTCSVQLMCRRPYRSDEDAEVVRLSEAAMKILGVEEMDRVVLVNGNRRVRCPILRIDDTASFFRENFPCEVNLVVGVPVHVRDELGIRGVKSCVVIERDVQFLFAKSMNGQIVSLLLALATAMFTTTVIPTWLTAVIFVLVVLPCVLYFNLSKVRGARGR